MVLRESLSHSLGPHSCGTLGPMDHGRCGGPLTECVPSVPTFAGGRGRSLPANLKLPPAAGRGLGTTRRPGGTEPAAAARRRAPIQLKFPGPVLFPGALSGLLGLCTGPRV